MIDANAAYLDLVGATDANDVRPVERVFIGDADVSEAIYRLLKAAREGQRRRRRCASPASGPARALAAAARAAGRRRAARRPADRVDAHRRDPRARAAGERLSGAAARHRLSRSRAGRLLLGRCPGRHRLSQRDARRLARPRPGPGRLGRPEARRHRRRQWRRAADDARRGARRGQDRGVRPRPQDAQRPHLPVRLFHKVAFGADGAPGASRTLVLNRARGDGTDPQRAAEVRFMRFFHNTPMAIATVDRAGRIARTNTLFARLFHGALSDGSEQAARSSPWSPSATAPRSESRDRARPPPARATSRRSMRRLPATASALRPLLSSRRSRTTSATARPRSSTCSRPPEQRELENQVAQSAEDGVGRPARRRHRARLQQRARPPS